jgi:hypothetical protein
MTSDDAAESTAPTRPGRASEQDGTHPRPQLLRAAWTDLGGPWDFRYEDDLAAEVDDSRGFDPQHTITVPFPPESVASGIGDTGFHPVVWYQRRITADDLRTAGHSAAAPRVLLHFGAVDHRATVWIDGALVGAHEGGHTPFSVDVTKHLTDHPDEAGQGHLLVVRAEDDPHDVTQPRGKQDWHEDAHAIWYRRTTGIWQTVWLEAVPALSVEHVRWLPSAPDAVEVTVRFRGHVTPGTAVRIALSFAGAPLGTTVFEDVAASRPLRAVLSIAAQRNGQAEDELTWSPEHPRLVDATIEVLDAGGGTVDVVTSYLGLRTVAAAHGAFLLNGAPYDVRSVLNQGYWPDSHLTAPSVGALRDEVELIRALGFTACRVHQKIEDPRFLFWADRLGLLVWAEMPGAYEFSPEAVDRLVREWIAAVDRDVAHPSVVTWVPFNESWGIQQVRRDPAQQAFARGVVDLTRALDPTRPVIANDGWEQQNTDVITVHDYEGDGARFAASYADDAARTALLRGLAPSGHEQLVGGAADHGQPVMVTEFGGVDYQPGERREDGWGYTAATDGDDWIARIMALYDGIRASTFLAGSCWTQLTDTMQETNGLVTADRRPKVAIDEIRRAVVGR